MVEDGNIWSCNNIFNPAKADGKGWKECIDCRTNEPLFLAIAALRYDTDDSQWFTDGKDWFLCQYLKVGMHYQDKPEILFDKWHKASVDELIEHFKQ